MVTLRRRKRRSSLEGAPGWGEAESISIQFASSGEYAARSQTNAQYVGDLYNAFVGRGGELAGVQFWIRQLDTGAQYCEQVRRDILIKRELAARRRRSVREEQRLEAGMAPHESLTVPAPVQRQP